jgi:hypothetical protein
MAREVDALIIVVPGGAETRNMINAEVLEALGPADIVINMARGSVVDEPALIAALRDRRSSRPASMSSPTNRKFPGNSSKWKTWCYLPTWDRRRPTRARRWTSLFWTICCPGLPAKAAHAGSRNTAEKITQLRISTLA